MSTPNLHLLGLISPVNSRHNKCLVAARFAGLNIDNVGLELGKENESKDYLSNCHPLGRVPVLQTEEGYLFESRAILRYLARADKTNSGLYGKTNFEASQIDMWLDYSNHEVDPAGILFLAWKYFGVPCDPKAENEAVAKAHHALQGLDNWLETRTFLVGERLSIADIDTAFTVDWIFRAANNGEQFKKHKNVWRHYNTVMQQPKTIEVLDSLGAEIGCTPAKEEKKKEEKAPKEEKPKEKAAPAAATASASADAHGHGGGDDEDEAPVEKKAKNPLDLLPPSTFVLDTYKKCYSNNDTRKVAAPEFFKTFDPAGFTAYWCKYKYNKELKKHFMTGNLIRGWYQRMEDNRKYAFGSVLILGVEGNHEIQGFWVFRGKGLPASVKEVEDTELFDWIEIPDVNKEAEKITDYLSHEGASFAATPVMEGKVFK